MCQDQVTRIYNRMNSISQHISRIRHNKSKYECIYYINDKMSDTAEAKYKYGKNSPKLSRAPQGRRLGDERLEVLVLLVAPDELPRVGRN